MSPPRTGMGLEEHREQGSQHRPQGPRADDRPQTLAPFWVVVLNRERHSAERVEGKAGGLTHY